MASEPITDPPVPAEAPGDADAADDLLFCPECGAPETGFFCRQCGTLLRGEEKVLCPRCHQIVPDGDYCNQCGQSLVGIALNLRQLAMAGDDFMITSTTAPPSPAAARVPVVAAAEDTLALAPDESIELEAPELPDWLEELPKTRAPREVRERIYPTLRPVESNEATQDQGRYLVAVVILLTLALVGLVGFVLIVLARVI